MAAKGGEPEGALRDGDEKIEPVVAGSGPMEPMAEPKVSSSSSILRSRSVLALRSVSSVRRRAAISDSSRDRRSLVERTSATTWSSAPRSATTVIFSFFGRMPSPSQISESTATNARPTHIKGREYALAGLRAESDLSSTGPVGPPGRAARARNSFKSGKRVAPPVESEN